MGVFGYVRVYTCMSVRAHVCAQTHVCICVLVNEAHVVVYVFGCLGD